MKWKLFKPINWLSNLVWHVKSKVKFEGSEEFWNKRYNTYGTSGPGSYGRLAAFKSSVINDFLQKHEVASVIDFGCGDGNQIRDIKFPKYLGFDVSEKIIQNCRVQFKDRKDYQFKIIEAYTGEKADLTLSLDVIFHLVEDQVFQKYMERLFEASKKYIIIYSSNYDQITLNPFSQSTQVRHRKFTNWINKNANNWNLYEFIENPYLKREGDSAKSHSHSNFYIFTRKSRKRS